jgi:3-oxoadipate enol-lactonase
MPTVALHHQADGPESAPVLVLGSSLGTSAEMWRAQIPALAGRLRVIRYDHRGHGGSPPAAEKCEIEDLAHDVVALLDRLEIERASFGGFSLGGMVAIWIGANVPARVDRLVLCCTSAHMPPASAWVERAAAVRAAGTTAVVADAVVERWLTPAFAAHRPDLVEWLRGMLVATAAAGYAACCGAIERMDMRADLERIAAPTLVVSAEQDPATPPEHQRVLADGIRGARLESIAGAAHLACIERPDEVGRLMLDHLEEAIQ